MFCMDLPVMCPQASLPVDLSQDETRPWGGHCAKPGPSRKPQGGQTGRGSTVRHGDAPVSGGVLGGILEM